MRFGPTQEACDRAMRGIHALYFFLAAIMVRSPTKASVGLAVLALVVIGEPAYGGDPVDFAFTFALMMVYCGALLTATVLRDRSLRAYFADLIVATGAALEVAVQRRAFVAIVEAAVPPRLLWRLHQLTDDVALVQLVDSSPDALVCATGVANFEEYAATQLLKETIASVYRCFTHFDTALASFGLDPATTYGDVYVVTGRLIQGNTAYASAACEFAVWQMTTFASYKCPLHCAVASGALAGGMAGEASLRYVVTGPALRDALTALSAVPAGSVWASKATVLHDEVRLQQAGLQYRAVQYKPPQDRCADEPVKMPPPSDGDTGESMSLLPNALTTYVDFRAREAARLRLGPAVEWFAVYSRAMWGARISATTRPGELGSSRESNSPDESLSSLPRYPSAIPTGVDSSTNVPEPESSRAALSALMASVNPSTDKDQQFTADIDQSDVPETQFWCGTFTDPVLALEYIQYVQRLNAREGPLLFAGQAALWLGIALVAGAERLFDPRRNFATHYGYDVGAFLCFALPGITAIAAAFVISKRNAAHAERDRSKKLDQELIPTVPSHLVPVPGHDARSPSDHTGSYELSSEDSLAARSPHPFAEETVAAVEARRESALEVSPVWLSAVWFVLVALGMCGLFLLQRSVVTNSPHFVLFALLPGTTLQVLRVLPWFASALVTAAAVLLPVHAASYYHMGVPTAGSIATIFVSVLVVWWMARDGSNVTRVKAVIGLRADKALLAAAGNARLLRHISERLVPAPVTREAVAVLGHDLSSRSSAGWRTTNPARQLQLLQRRALRPKLVRFLPDFVAVEVRLRMSSDGDSASSSSSFAQPPPGYPVRDAPQPSAATKSHEQIAVRLLRRWQSIGQLVEAVCSEDLAMIQTLGDSFTLGGPFSAAEHDHQARAVESAVLLLASLAGGLGIAEGFTAAAVIEEAYGAIVGECSMRFRVFGVAMLHSTALAEASSVAQESGHRPRRLLFCSRRFAALAGPVVQLLSPPPPIMSPRRQNCQLVGHPPAAVGANLPSAWCPTDNNDSTSLLVDLPPKDPRQVPNVPVTDSVAAGQTHGADSVHLIALPSQKWRLRSTGVTRVFPLQFVAPGSRSADSPVLPGGIPEHSELGG
jgi:hypothetical protein